MFVFQACSVESATLLRCTAPAIPSLTSTAIDPDYPLPLNFGFRLDGVTSLRNWTRVSGDAFMMFPDPMFEEFPDDVRTFQPDSHYLTINVG